MKRETWRSTRQDLWPKGTQNNMAQATIKSLLMWKYGILLGLF